MTHSAPLAYRILAQLPLPILHLIGTLLGYLLWMIPNKHRDIAATNIRLCLPELSNPLQRRLLRRAMVQAGRALAEGPLIWHGPERRVLNLLKRIEGYELVTEALTRGQGVITAAPHLGAWEVAGLEYSRLHPITSLYKTQKGDWDRLIKAGRERFGAQLVPSDNSGVRKLLATLRQGETAGILPDQDPPAGSGVFADFFGIPAHTPVLLQRLARRTGATVVYMYAERLSWGRGFVLHFAAAPTDVDHEDDHVAAHAINQGVETCVRLLPEQYWWAYARFRRRPEEAPEDLYNGLAD